MTAPRLAGRAVLLVEDEYLVAQELACALERLGATVVGPAANVRRALELVAGTPRLAGAVLDVDVRSEPVFAVADALRARGIPFVFATGFDREVIPEGQRDAPVLEKPVDVERVVAALFPAP